MVLHNWVSTFLAWSCVWQTVKETSPLLWSRLWEADFPVNFKSPQDEDSAAVDDDDFGFQASISGCAIIDSANAATASSGGLCVLSMGIADESCADPDQLTSIEPVQQEQERQIDLATIVSIRKRKKLTIQMIRWTQHVLRVPWWMLCSVPHCYGWHLGFVRHASTGHRLCGVIVAETSQRQFDRQQRKKETGY